MDGLHVSKEEAKEMVEAANGPASLHERSVYMDEE
jgi:hypothetical protein